MALPEDDGGIVTPETPALSMRETMESAFDAINERERQPAGHDDDDAPRDEKTITATPAPRKADARVRGPDGKFQAGSADVAQVPETSGDSAPAAAIEPQVRGDGKPLDLSRPPGAFSPRAKADWDKTPESIRAEAYKRENDFHRGTEVYKARAEVGRLLYTEIQPFEALIRANGADAPAAIRAVLGSAARLYAGQPAQKIAELRALATLAGVDPRQLMPEQNAEGQPAVDPRFQQLEQRYQRLEQAFMGQRRDSQNAGQQEALSVVDKFMSDPKNRYASNVQADMLALLQNGTAQTLDKAYAIACNANPEIASLLEQERRAAWAAEQQQKSQQRATTARNRGSVNVRHSPTNGTAPATQLSWKEGLRAAGKALLNEDS